MESWITQSSPGKQTALAAACALVGLALVIGFRGFNAAGSNALAGFVMGVFLLILGIAGLAGSGKQTVTVDPRTRRITVEDSSRLGTKKRLIPFNDVVSVGIGYLGKRSNRVEFFFLVLQLRNGKTYPLFAPGRFFEGGSDRATVESWKRRLEGYLGLG